MKQALPYFLVLCVGALQGCPGTTDPDPDTPSDGGVAPHDAGASDGGGDDATDVSDAGTPSTCATPGETRVGSCGMCGTRQETCSSIGVWEETTPCLGEGVCTPGAADTRATPGCGEETRLCDTSCVWLDWLRSMPDTGVCTTGERRFAADPDSCAPYLVNEETCSAACAWEVTTACTDECGGSARTSPEWERERCIPAGTFIRGRNTGSQPDERPEAEIFVSSFYLDVYPVTNRRYRECLEAVVCNPLGTPDSDAMRSFNDPLRDDYPIEDISYANAVEFCEWDGMRRLATDAELAKAARGPAPSRDRYPWGDTYNCADFGWCTSPAGPYNQDFEYDEQPLTASIYGIHRLLGAGYERVSDRYRDTYYSDPASTVPDPTGPATGTRSVRGSDPYLPGTGVDRRSESGVDAIGFRCARALVAE